MTSCRRLCRKRVGWGTWSISSCSDDWEHSASQKPDYHLMASLTAQPLCGRVCGSRKGLFNHFKCQRTVVEVSLPLPWGVAEEKEVKDEHCGEEASLWYSAAGARTLLQRPDWEVSYSGNRKALSRNHAEEVEWVSQLEPTTNVQYIKHWAVRHREQQ